MAQEKSREVQGEEIKKGIAEAEDMVGKETVIIVSGINELGDVSNSVEMFRLSSSTWTPLQPRREGRYGASSVVYNVETSQELPTGNTLKTSEGRDKLKDIEEETIIVIAGGDIGNITTNSVEMFSLLHGNWKLLVPMIDGRSDASSFLYNDHFIVAGGLTSQGPTNTMEMLSLNADQADPITTWKNVSAELPGRLVGHRSVIYNRRLIVIGGCENENDHDGVYSNSITEIPLDPSDATHLLDTLLDRRSHHGVAIFGDKILILGGKDGITGHSMFRSVYMYSITDNSLQELNPLPYPVCEMATVKCGDDNVMIIGGVDGNLQPVNKVLMYKISTEQHKELPPMQYRRKGCVAVVAENSVIVMGGKGINEECLNSVERFNFRNRTWETLPEMQEKRYCATAVVYQYKHRT